MRRREILIIFAAAISILCITILPSIGSAYGLYINAIDDVRVYNNGWYYISGDEKIFFEAPRNIKTGGEEGKITIYHDVTKENAGKWLLITISGYGLRAYADDALIYENHYMDSPKYGKIPTAGQNYIPIPENAACIALEFTCPYRGQARRIPAIYIGKGEAELLYLNHTLYQYHHFMDLWIMLFGLFVCLCSGYCMFRHDRSRAMAGLYLGVLLIAVGLWLRIGTFDVEIRRVPKEILYGGSYQLWYCIPVLLCGYISYMLEAEKRKYRLLQLICLGTAVFIYLARNWGLAEYSETVFLTHIELVILFSALIIDGVKIELTNWKMHRRINFRFAGLMIMAVFGGIELIYYSITSQPTGLYIRLGIILCVSLIVVDEVKKRVDWERDFLEHEAERRTLQLKTVMSQLQPHFIFNALGAIRLMIHMDSETAYDMIYDFSQFLRANLHAVQNDDMVPFSSELAQIRAYMNIENKRFNNRIQAKYDIQTMDFMLPALTVEPLVANAVIHGLRKGTDSGTVTLRTYKRDRYIYIEIADNGIGMDTDRMNAISKCDSKTQELYMSFANVRRRLELQTGAVVEIESEPGKGTCVRIIMPVTDKTEDMDRMRGKRVEGNFSR